MFVDPDDPEGSAGAAGGHPMLRYDRACARLAEVSGVINAAHGEVVAVVCAALDAGVGVGIGGLRSNAEWVAWQAGVSPGRARDIVRIAERRHEIPAALAALTAGTLTLDQVSVIARFCPTGYDQSVTSVAHAMTVSQLRRSLSKYGWDHDAKDSPVLPAERGMTFGRDNRGSWLKIRMDEAEAALLERVALAHKDDLYRQLCDSAPEGAPKPVVSIVDGLISAAEAALQAAEAKSPGSDRYSVIGHLEAGLSPDAAILGLEGGPALPDHIRRMLLCDCPLTTVIERDGVPIHLGRQERTVNRALRRILIRRDGGGCRVPGCGSRLGLHLHHIWHWEDGGPTDPENLVTLCNRHHRQHHLPITELGITGNPNLPNGTPGCVEFTDRLGRTLDQTGHPIPVLAGAHLETVARERGIVPGVYRHPCGERLRPSDVIFNPNPGWTPPGTEPGASGPPHDDDPAQPTDIDPPGPTGHGRPRFDRPTNEQAHDPGADHHTAPTHGP